MLDIQKRLSNSFYALLALPATAMGFALTVQIAALSWILSTQYGLNISEVGIVWATGPIAGIIGQVVIGIISDKVWFWNGRRRPFILIGGVLASLMILALPNIGVIQKGLGLDGVFGIAIVVSMTLDLSINLSFNPTRAIIADVTPEGRERTKGYTWMQTVSGTFGVLAYLIGAVFDNFVLLYFGVGLVFFFSVIPPLFVKEPKYLGRYGEDEDELDRAAQEAAAEGTIKSLDDLSFLEIVHSIRPLWGFLVYAVYAIVMRLSGFEFAGYYFEGALLAITLFFIAEALLKSEAGKPKEEAGLIGFRKVLAAHSFTWIGVQSMFIYLFAYVDFRLPALTDAELGDVINWSFFSLSVVAAILPVVALEPLADRFGRVKVHAVALACSAAGYVGILVLGVTPWAIYLWMAVVGIGWASTISLPFAIMSQKIPQEKMGLYMGLFNLSVVLPQLVASFGVGEVVDAADNKGIVFVICAATLAFSSLAWFLVREPRDEQTANPALLDQQVEEQLDVD
jgi:maltose/moltooligosaccharide transporter